MMRAWTVVSVAALAGGLAGCSSTATSFGEDYEEALCEWASRCRVFEDEKQCKKALVWESHGRFDYMVEAIAAGRASFDADAAERCFAAIEAQACEESALNAVLFSRGFAAAPEACGAVYVGKVGNYEPCIHSGECAGDAVCGFPPCDGGCCEGSCRAQQALPKRGEPCNGACEEDAYCAVDPVTGLSTTCEARLAAGADCEGLANACADGLFCRYEPDGDDGRFTCAALRGEGDSCDYGEGCAEGLVCYSWERPGDDRVSRCQVLPQIGDACSTSNYPACGGIASACEDGTCRPFGVPDEPCLDGNDCVPFAECRYDGEAPTCVARAGLGESCGSTGGSYVSCLGHLTCEGDRCVEPAPEASCSVPK